MDFNAQPFGFQQTQPISTVTTNTETAYAGANTQQNGTAEQTKARFTRAERRAFAKEKRAVQGPKHHSQRDSKKDFKKDFKKDSKRDARIPHDVKNIDDAIALLLAIRGKEGRQARDLSRITKSLESRITRGSVAVAKKQKKEPSAKRLEKLAKRKELRIEKRKARLAEKSEQSANAQVQQADGVPSIQEIQQSTGGAFDDEITF